MTQSNNGDQSLRNLFVYGTLQHGQSRNHLLQGLDCRKAILHGYLRMNPPQLGYPFIVKVNQHNAMVKGEIYFGLSQNHWKEIDIVEGEGELYHRIIVEVESFERNNSRKIPAFTYYPDEVLISRFYED
jgi:gamma-glutamylcyclotransferase (GGCT)/AIG2-like uncharacterized protein YtfP